MLAKMKNHYLVNTSDENLVESDKALKYRKLKKYKSEFGENEFQNHKILSFSLKKKWILTFVNCFGIGKKKNQKLKKMYDMGSEKIDQLYSIDKIIRDI